MDIFNPSIIMYFRASQIKNEKTRNGESRAVLDHAPNVQQIGLKCLNDPVL